MGIRTERLHQERRRLLLNLAVTLTIALVAGGMTTAVVLWYRQPTTLAQAAPPRPVAAQTPTPPAATVWPVPVWDAKQPAHGIGMAWTCDGVNLDLAAQITNISGKPLGRAGLRLTFLDSEGGVLGATEGTVGPLAIEQAAEGDFASTVPCSAADNVTRIAALLLFCDPAPRPPA